MTLPGWVSEDLWAAGIQKEAQAQGAQAWGLEGEENGHLPN